LSVITKRYVEVEKRPQIKKSPFSVLDFEKDGDYIYASFMQAYKIDLIEEQGRLPWKKFLYLFNGLPADTKIKQIMRIRQMPVPEYNGKNSKEIQEINEKKWLPKSVTTYGNLDSIKNDILIYYEYSQFKRTYFDSTGETKYDKNTGRITELNFKCVGIGE